MVIIDANKTKNEVNIKIGIVLLAWLLISISIVLLSMYLMPLLFRNILTSNEFTYSDAIGLCLNSLLSTALAIIGASNAIDTWNASKTAKETYDLQRDRHPQSKTHLSKSPK